jgi:hypothetical protein
MCKKSAGEFRGDIQKRNRNNIYASGKQTGGERGYQQNRKTLSRSDQAIMGYRATDIRNRTNSQRATSITDGYDKGK